ncbi:MAG TPA: fumarylacetoacetate hydrolase family protein [Acidimicrobiia bacterium]|nr:fumarylacetoacetate hydrolase family protein [Acidimicrobiia bacterium]
MIDDRVSRGLRRQMERRAAELADGRRPIGWKAGFGAPATLEKFRLDGPLVGYMTEASLVANGATVDISGWRNPVAEPEMAVWIGADIPADPTEHDVRRAIAALAPAIELADVYPPPEDVEEALAGNVFHRGVILGDRDERRAGGHVEDLTATVSRDGENVAVPNDLESITGRIPDVVAHLARLAAAAREPIRAGDVIITGSIVPPLALAPGVTVSYELAGYPTLTVHAG